MSEHDADAIPPEGDDDVEAHLIKEALAAGAVSAAIFAGTAQAQVPLPGGGGGGGVVSNPGAGGGAANMADPGAGAGGANVADPGTGAGGAVQDNPGGGTAGAMNTDPGGGSSLGARKSKPTNKAPAKTRKASKVKKHR